MAACSGCDVRAICDGFYGDYADLFGEGEARPIRLANEAVSDLQHFTRNQQKRVHPRDIAWLDGATNS
ncbi:MAG: hypothetical protein FJW31_05290 [Acidobacteria bacterium]|nr:hypothetical protein [Acidobacteriota bacterium]